MILNAYFLRVRNVGYTGTFIVKSALQIAPLVFVRPTELRHAEWAHIDLESNNTSDSLRGDSTIVT